MKSFGGWKNVNTSLLKGLNGLSVWVTSLCSDRKSCWLDKKPRNYYQHLLKYGKPQKVLSNQAGCSQSAVSKHFNRKLRGKKMCSSYRDSLKRISKWSPFNNLEQECQTPSLEGQHSALPACSWILGSGVNKGLQWHVSWKACRKLAPETWSLTTAI